MRLPHLSPMRYFKFVGEAVMACWLLYKSANIEQWKKVLITFIEINWIKVGRVNVSKTIFKFLIL